MKAKLPLLLSGLAWVCPVMGILIMSRIEPEFAEAFLAGLLFGCIAGSVPGVLALLLNKSRNKFVTVLSVIPMSPLAAYLVLAIPYLTSVLK